MEKLIPFFIRYFKLLICLFFIQVKADSKRNNISLDYVHTNFTTKEGLPSNETYCIYQDNRGYIWIGTDRGLVRYDGYEFKTYTTLDGLLDNVIVAINEDHQGNLWYTGLNTDEVGYIDTNLNFHSHSFNSDLIKKLSDIEHSSIYFNQIYRGQNSMFLVNRTLGYVEIKEGDIEVNIKGLNEGGNKGIHIKENTASNFIYADFRIFSGKNIPFKIWNDDSLIYSYKKDNARFILPTLIEDDSLRVVYDGRDQFEINRNNIVKHSRLNSLCIAYEFGEQGYIYSLHSENGNSQEVYYSKSARITDKKEKLLNDVIVSGVLYDSKGRLWLTTTKHGLYYFPELSSKKALDDYQIEVLLPLTEGIFIEANQNLDNDGLFYSYEEESIEKVDFKIYRNLIDKTERRNKFFGSIIIHDVKESRRWIDGVVSDHVGILGIQSWSDSLLFIWNRNAVLKVVDTFSWAYYGVRIKEFKSSFYYPRIKSAYCKRTGECYLATANGIYYYDEESLKKLPYEEDKYIKDITYNENLGVLLYSVWGEGLMIRYDDGLVKQITTNDGLTSNFINQIYEDKLGTLWLVTNNGINETNLTSDGLIIRNRFQSTKLLNSPNVLQIFKKDSVLYIGTDAGLNVLNLKYIQDLKKTEMPLFIDSVKIEGYSSLKNYQNLEYDQNNIVVYYTGISYSQYGDINYRYRLKGLFDNWVYTKERKVVFMSLEPGDYQFELESQNEYGDWAPLEGDLEIKIKKPYWLHWWFIGGLTLIIFSVIAGALYYYISNLKKEKLFLENEQKLSEELNESQQKALSSQLNPHFVFNSLNSIQNFILTKRTELSSDYLSMFSKLMRFVFENSKKLYIPLTDEIEALNLYLELEQVRHNHKFKYEINTSDIDTHNIFIPALLIQPIIENAIWHGLLHKVSEDKMLEIKFSKTSNFLCIVVQDNGIGRSVSKPRPKFIKKQKSSGLDLTKQRLRLLSDSTGLKTDFIIQDLYNDDNSAAGTKVIISIPLSLKLISK